MSGLANEERLGYKCVNNVPAICEAISYPCDSCKDWKPVDEEKADELEGHLQRLTMDDVLKVVFWKNLYQDMVYIQYGITKDFFEGLMKKPINSSCEKVDEIIRRAQVRGALDEALTRVVDTAQVLKHSNSVPNVYEMSAAQQERVSIFFAKLSTDEKAALEELAQRYGNNLCAKCLIPYRQCAGQCVGLSPEISKGASS